MKSIKTILAAICVAIISMQSQPTLAGPDPFIYEVHPHTLYLVVLEYDTTVGEQYIYKPIPSTPDHSKNICRVKPQACYRPVSDLPPPPGYDMLD